MTDIPFENIIKLQTSPFICKFTDINNLTPKYRFHLIIPLKFGMYIKCDITSKLYKRIYYYHNSGLTGSDDCIIEICPENHGYLSQRSMIDCNQVIYYQSSSSLCKNIKDKFEIINYTISEDLLKTIKEKITKSPYVKKHIKQYLLNS